MADINFILQAVTKANHAESIRALLQLPKPTQVVVSVAFARTAGLEALQDRIKPLAGKTKFFVGIRNDITSIQAIRQLLALKLDLYAVDTGSRKVIFHPKLYLAANASNAIAIVGSANMTFSGLHTNIEVSTRIALDFAKNPADKTYVDTVVTAFDKMLEDHPNHVFRIKDDRHAAQLFDEGRLADETVIVAPTSGSSVKNGDGDDLGPMKLVRVSPTYLSNANAATGAATVRPASGKPITGIKYRVWHKTLSRRDLSIPTNPNTKLTGSMGFTRGTYDIDQRSHFYDEIFKGLAWMSKKTGAKKLWATAKFELVIKNISYGAFALEISHKTDTEFESFRQSQFMTQIHWGEARPLVAKQDLLGRSVYLYRKDSTPPEFMIEID